MSLDKIHNLACPLDGEVLQLSNQQLRCTNGHSFDIARQGYVNLLPVQQKRSKDPGDSKDMVLARSNFLNTGVYEPVVSLLADKIETLIRDQDKLCLLDAGCGEGYYTDWIVKYLEANNQNKCLSVVGLDISKPAIHEAAKRNKQIGWVVGTNRQPPLLADSVDIILCVFGFQSFDGFKTILKPGGRIILVEPGPNHLTELREIIYSDVKKTEPMALTHLASMGLVLEETQKLNFKTGPIDNDSIRNLLLMTPHFYRANKEGRKAALNLDEIDLTVDVVFRLLKKI